MTQRKRSEKNPRAAAFSAHLRAWIAQNKKDYDEGKDLGEPRNPGQLASRLTRSGEKCGRSTAQGWYDGTGLPESRFVALLERWMVAPWVYLDDPGKPWPPPVDVVAAFGSILADPAALRRIAAAVSRPPAADRGGRAR